MSIESQIITLGEQLPAGTTLVAVSKTHPVDALMQAYNAGQRIFGENRPQEMTAKFDAMPGDTRWHMIGHLQTNKVRMIMPFVELIHSVDSARLLAVIDAEAARAGRVVDVLMEVHIGQEAAKSGWDADELREFMNKCHCEDASRGTTELRRGNLTSPFANVRIRGLMGIATFTDDTEQVRREFLGLRALFEELGGAIAGGVPTPFVPSIDLVPVARHATSGAGHSVLMGHSVSSMSHFDTLSMGMSADWRIALECGATMIRLGSTIFGVRS